MALALRHFLPNYFQDFFEKTHWVVFDYNGKSDLEKSFPRIMKQWHEPGSRFIVLRDNDGSDCRLLKQRLSALVPAQNQPHLIRIVCQELESWFLGDMQAIGEAYPASTRHDQFKSLSKRDPDGLTNASELVRSLTGTGAKRLRATEIAKKMRASSNRSASFQVFLSGLQRLRAA